MTQLFSTSVHQLTPASSTHNISIHNCCTSSKYTTFTPLRLYNAGTSDNAAAADAYAPGWLAISLILMYAGKISLIPRTTIETLFAVPDSVRTLTKLAVALYGKSLALTVTEPPPSIPNISLFAPVILSMIWPLCIILNKPNDCGVVVKESIDMV